MTAFFSLFLLNDSIEPRRAPLSLLLLVGGGAGRGSGACVEGGVGGAGAAVEAMERKDKV